MRRALWFVAAIATGGLLLAAAPPLFQAPTESIWDVSTGGKKAGAITLITDGRSSRVEWTSGQQAPTVLIASGGKIWVRAAGGDVELAQWKGGAEKNLLPAFLLPATTTSRDAVDLKNGKPASYSFGTSSAAYVWDDKGPKTVEIKSGSSAWTATRSSVGKPSSTHASVFEVKPKRSATSRLAAMAGGLLGPADTSVAATAGGRGVEKGGRFEDGGDYEALAKLETDDDELDAALPEELEKFQKSGKIGRGRGGDR
jgi:hypothetical protein